MAERGFFVCLQLLLESTQALTSLILQEALKYFNQTIKQKEMLEFALNYLQTEDEVRSSAVWKTFVTNSSCCFLSSRVKTRAIIPEQSFILEDIPYLV